MARKKVDPRVAKEKRQKKIAAGGAVLLLALVGFQAPGIMKRMNEGEVAEAAPAAPTTPAPAVPAAGGEAPLEPPTLSGANPAAAPAAPAPAPAAPASAQLVSFSRFSSKDPFAPQVGVDGPSGGASAPPKDGKPAAEAEAEPGSEEGKPETGAAAPTSAQLAVNGTVEAVQVAAPFPAADPAFLLQSLTKKTATMAVAEGGSFAAGSATLKLELGKPVTLVNTADGTRYEVELRAVS